MTYQLWSATAIHNTTIEVNSLINMAHSKIDPPIQANYCITYDVSLHLSEHIAITNYLE